MKIWSVILLLCLAGMVLARPRYRTTRSKNRRNGKSKTILKKRAKQSVCPGLHRSPSKPISVNRLQFGDFDVIGAIGDSGMAATRALAKTFEEPRLEYRGRSFAAGGDLSLQQGVSTLPNILREFNPNLQGFATGSGDLSSEGANLNRAVPGALALNMTEQALDLIQQIQNDPKINFRKDWKLVTISVGGNDLCVSCLNTVAFSVESYIFNIRAALDTLERNLPRTYVNLIELPDLAASVSIELADQTCIAFVEFVCPCGRGPIANVQGMTTLTNQYNKALVDLVSSGRYDKETFTVVTQPFLQNTEAIFKANGEVDSDFYSPDCFHSSGKGQNLAGISLWNNMIEPVGLKSAGPLDPDDTIQCPKNRYFPTNTNTQKKSGYE